MNDYDVIVVGGGCAGLWAASEAARDGSRTLLVERMSHIGERIVCAEGIGAEGIGQFMDLEEEWVASRVDGGKLFKPDGHCVELDESGCGYVLHKDRFLAGLSEKASGEGVEIWTASEVSALKVIGAGELEVDISRASGNRTLRCGGLVVADGIESRLGRQAGIQTSLRPGDLFSCAQYAVTGIDVDPNWVEFHFGREIAPGGYAWVFPKGKAAANVGIGTICDSKIRSAPMDYLKRFKERRCPEAEVRVSLVGGVPSVKAPFKAFGQGIFLAGDSARVADPVSGAGIVPGMESGAAAGRAASACSRNGSDLQSIEKGFARSLKACFKDRRLRSAVRKILARMTDKELCRMIDLTGEYASRGSLLKGDPFRVMGFLAKAMPSTFGMLRHLVGV